MGFVRARLGIDGLPDRFEGMAGGLIYGIVAEQQALRIALLARTLAANLAEGLRCVLVTPFEASTLLKKSEMVGVDLGFPLVQGQLTLMPGSEPVETSGVLRAVRRMVGELTALGLPAGSVTVVDQAELVLGLAEPSVCGAATRTLQDWATRYDQVVVVLMGSRGSGPREAGTLKAISEGFAGFAIVGTVEDDPVLEVRHWFGRGGAVPRSSYVLALGADGALVARQAATGARVSIDPALERGVVTRRAADGFSPSPEGWQLVDGYLDAIDRARHLLAGTVVLNFDRASTLRDLAQTVAALRALARPQLRVVVRESGARLRLPQLVALLRLGVSLVIPQDVPGPSARLMAESLRGSLVTRTCETDVDHVLEEAKADAESGAMRIDRFRERVEALLMVSGDLDMPHTLVRCSLLTAQALRAVQGALRRGARDLVFAEHDESLWVFLFGCAPEHAEPLMARLLGARFVRLLAGWQAIGGAADIRQTLALLDHAVPDPGDEIFPDTVIVEPIAEHPAPMAERPRAG